MISRARTRIGLGLMLVACGGAAPAPVTPADTNPPTPTPSATATDAEAPPGVSVVLFDDLGVSFAVQPGWHVMGDDALAARIRASANPRLTASLQSHAGEKKALPLLTLSREAIDKNDALTVTITAAVVPQDASAIELLNQQQIVMKDNLENFTIVAPPKDHTQDGVAGVELADRYGLHGGAKMASVLRLHVRAGLAISIVAVWPDTAPAARLDEARAVLDGLHFYPPTP